MSGNEPQLHDDTNTMLAMSMDKLQEQFREQQQVLGEAFSIIYKSGLLETMSPKAREFLSESEFVQQAITSGEGPSLEPRLTLDEYCKHIINILDVPATQTDFTFFIVKVCYVMILAEKNPLVAQELRGVLQVNTALKDIMKGR